MPDAETQRLMDDESVFNSFLAYYCKNCFHSGSAELCDETQSIRPDGWGNLACTRYRCKVLEWMRD